MKTFRKILLWIFVGLLSLGQLQRVELQQYNIAFYLHDIFIIFWIFHVLFTDPIKDIWDMYLTGPDLGKHSPLARDIKCIPQKFVNYLSKFFKKERKIQIFIALALFSLIINLVTSLDLISLLYTARLITYIIFGFTLSFLIKNKKIDLEYLKFQVFSIGLISLFLGFLQYHFIKDTRFLSILGWDDHYARLISTYFDPGFTGIIFISTLFIGLSSKYLQNKITQLFLIFFFTLGVVLTFSRASYLALIAGFLVIAWSVHFKNLNSNKKSLLVKKTKYIPLTSLSQLKFNKKLSWVCASHKIYMVKDFFKFIAQNAYLELLKKIFLGSLLFLTLIILTPKPFGEGVNLLRTSTINARYLALTQQLKNIKPKTLIIGNGPYSEKNSLNYLEKINLQTELNNINSLDRSEFLLNKSGVKHIPILNKTKISQNLIPSHSRVPDNIFMNVLLSMGILGLILFILILFNWGKQLKSQNIFMFAGFIALLISTQFNSSLIQPFVLLIFLSGVTTLEK